MKLMPRAWTLQYLRFPRVNARSSFSWSKMGRSYGDAIAALNTLQSNATVVEAVRKSGGRMNETAKAEMLDWVQRLGYEPSDFDRLNPIHIAGTKGKGSTSTFISSILAQYLPSPKHSNPVIHKIGLYTSPHLRFVRERIQINNEPLTEDDFAKYFFETWDRFESSARQRSEPPDVTAKPAYFRFLTLMAFHTYLSEGVDTAIIECGVGGEYDSTNILIRPTVTAITSLGIDHTAILGNTIEEIAWHKGGIMKQSAPCFTAPQPATAFAVLERRATEVPTKLTLVTPFPELSKIKLGLAGTFQCTNASLALTIAGAHLLALGYRQMIEKNGLPIEVVRGLESAHLSGRCETRLEGKMTWCMDSGHTLESIALAAGWFGLEIKKASQPKKRTRILLFNQQTRDASALATRLYQTLDAAAGADKEQPFTHAVFCSNKTFQQAGFRPDLQNMNVTGSSVDNLDVQKKLAETWKGLDPKTQVEVKGSIDEAVEWCRGIASADAEEEEGAMVLVTGSVHLVGGFLEVLETGRPTG